jgi:hypothetical protein
MKAFINKIITWLYGDKAAQFDKEYSQIKQGLESHDAMDVADRFAFMENHLNGKKISTDYSSHQDSNVDLAGFSNDTNE